MLSDGAPVRPFNIVTLAAPKGNPEIIANLKELSYLKFGKDKDEVQEAIMEKYKKAPVSDRI